MINNKKILALIPARGGSKGLSRKNIKNILGKPLIAWSIEHAKKSKYIDNVIVSTDDTEIASVARKFDADVPFIRPKKLALDTSGRMGVIFHTIDFLEKNNEHFEILIFLEPTSPLREVADIDKALEKLIKNSDAESIVGVSQVENIHPSFLVKLENQFIRSYNNADFKVLRRQDLENLYFYEGSLYISYIESLKKWKEFYHKNCLGYIVPKWKSYEVDDLSDFIVIEALLKAKQNGLLV